jgi:hypothetical protein
MQRTPLIAIPQPSHVVIVMPPPSAASDLVHKAIGPGQAHMGSQLNGLGPLARSHWLRLQRLVRVATAERLKTHPTLLIPLPV